MIARQSSKMAEKLLKTETGLEINGKEYLGICQNSQKVQNLSNRRRELAAHFMSMQELASS